LTLGFTEMVNAK